MFSPIVEGPRGSSQGGHGRLIASSKKTPCPVCGRTKDGDCRIGNNGVVLCHKNTEHNVGDIITGVDGRQWAFTKASKDNRAGVFTLHQPRLTVVASGGTAITNGRSKAVSGVTVPAEDHAGTAIALPRHLLSFARFFPEAMHEESSWTEEENDSVFFYYNATNRSQQKRAGKKKQIYAHYWSAANQQWATGFKEDCPCWNERLIPLANGLPVYFEGEHCAEIATQRFDLIGLSLPGQIANNLEKCTIALKRHKEAGLEVVVYVADNDDEGKKKKCLMNQAANNAGLPFIGLNAADIWEGLPKGGSIDDIDPFQYDHESVVATLEKAVDDAVNKASLPSPPAPETSHANASGASFEIAWASLQAAADDFVKGGGSILKQRSGLANTATNLGINRLTQADLDRLIHAAQRRLRPASNPLEGGTIFKAKRQPFVLEGLVRHGLNMLVSAPGVGKSRFCAALAAAWLSGKEKWLDKNLTGPNVDDRHVLVIGTDQGREDWAITLKPVGLCTSVDPFADDDEEELILDHRVTLHPLESDTRLDADGLAVIRRWCDDHPNCMVIIDSFAAVLPPGIDEEKPSAAQPLYALQEALGTCWCITCHHARKAAGKEGSIGVGTGRGSSAIEGAVSRLLTLSPIHRIEHGQRVVCEADPRRELVSTKRGGATQHLIINSEGWALEGTAEDLKKEERRERARQNLNDEQAEVLTLLEDAARFLTTREVVELLGFDWDKDRASGGKERRNALNRLDRLATLGLIEKVGSGTDKSWKIRG
jgi:hypothetical protein